MAQPRHRSTARTPPRSPTMHVSDPTAIRVARELRGFSQTTLGGMCGRSQQWAAKLEAGKLRTIHPRLAEILIRNLGLPESVFGRAGSVSTAGVAGSPLSTGAEVAR